MLINDRLQVRHDNKQEAYFVFQSFGASTSTTVASRVAKAALQQSVYKLYF